MEKTYRNGVDIGVAFASRMKRHAITIAHGAPSGEILPAEPEVSGGGHMPLQATQEQAEPKRGLLKRMLRPLARAVFRGLKPFAAPIVFRFRRYVTAPMHQELLRTHGETLGLLRAHAETLESMHATVRANQEIYRTIERKQKALHEQWARQSAASVDSHQRSRERLDEVISSLQALKDSQNKNDKLVSELLSRQDRMSATLKEIEQYAYVTARRVAVPCGADEVLIRAESGYILCPSSDYEIIAGLIDTGDLERGTRLLIESLLEPGAVYVDVGANLGIHVLAAARNLLGQGAIICFEPYPQTANLLEKTVRMNGYADLVKIYQAAVTTKSGKQRLFLGLSSGHHSLFPLTQSAGAANLPVEVDAVCLDDVLAKQARVDVIKIDVEGAELDVLNGAQHTLERHQGVALIVEFGPSHLARSGQGAELWLAQFERLGFAWQAIDAISGALRACTVEELMSAESTNLFFARADSPMWERAGASHA
jgi:FkbM family methyltransferase